MIATVRQARSLLADPTLNVFENKEAFLFCNYDRAKALCHPGRGGKKETPSLDRCRSNCANIARTDSQVLRMKVAAKSLQTQASSGLGTIPARAGSRLLHQLFCRYQPADLSTFTEAGKPDKALRAASQGTPPAPIATPPWSPIPDHPPHASDDDACPVRWGPPPQVRET
ncbi:hypothetical protein [Streptomyces sp. BA2]|uniref:hypothetical protein n=1 Tax=Streptomyces sp. BA2 TaxID=436595 RepID=UPI0013259283|nr:hypothetical protein [Streptomyces sp. BA2]MWA16188.1 hypothetical protein [Streptomyces sp. BA2]